MDTQITLREGIEKFNRRNERYFSDRDTSDEAKEFFRCHDIAHVVFGCDTSIFGEGVVKTWTVFGTTLGFWRHISEYNEADAFQLFRMYSWQHVAKNIFQYLVSIPKIIFRAKRMNKPWDWSDFEQYLDVNVGDIRKEFNIHPVK